MMAKGQRSIWVQDYGKSIKCLHDNFAILSFLLLLNADDEYYWVYFFRLIRMHPQKRQSWEYEFGIQYNDATMPRLSMHCYTLQYCKFQCS